jgi:hypothetical protein
MKLVVILSFDNVDERTDPQANYPIEAIPAKSERGVAAEDILGRSTGETGGASCDI